MTQSTQTGLATILSLVLLTALYIGFTTEPWITYLTTYWWAAVVVIPYVLDRIVKFTPWEGDDALWKILWEKYGAG